MLEQSCIVDVVYTTDWSKIFHCCDNSFLPNIDLLDIISINRTTNDYNMETELNGTGDNRLSSVKTYAVRIQNQDNIGKRGKKIVNITGIIP